MKRFAMAAVAAIALLGLAGCDVFGSTETKKDTAGTTYTFPAGTGTGGTTSTVWWIKGSFDGWKGGGDFDAAPTDGSRHYLSADALNPNLLSLPASVLTGLTTSPVEFVVINATTKVKFDFVYTPSVSILADATPYTLVDSAAKLGSFNPAFFPTATTYSILVDVAKAAAPVVKLSPGATALTPATPTVATLAAALKIKGDAFGIGWADTAGTLSGNTVTFTGLVAGGKTGSFGFSAAEGFLKTDTVVASPTAVGAASAVTVSPRANNNIKISGMPNADSVYSVAVTIDPTKNVFAGRYSMVVSLTAVGSTAWPGPPSAVYFVGKLQGAAGMTEWSELDTGRAKVDLVANKAVLTYTATASGEQQFKWAVAANSAWNGLVGDGAPVAYDNTGTNVTLSGSGGNIIFTAVSGTVYTITVDYSAYSASNVITVKCTKP